MDTRAVWILAVTIVACHGSAAIAPDRDDASAPAVVDAAVALGAAPDGDVADASDAGDPADAGDAGDAADACIPGDVWEAHVRVRKTWHAIMGMMMPGPLELVVPRLDARKTLFPDCGITGGGCGDCSRRPVPGQIGCELTPSHVHVDIGLDDVGPTYVDVVQRGDAIVAHWTHGEMSSGAYDVETSTHSTETLVKLPCAVKIRFVP